MGHALVHRLFVAVQYVLLPSTRGWWDAQPLEGCYASARDLARIVVAAREGGTPDPSTSSRAEVVRAFLPARWIADMAAAGGHAAALVGPADPDAGGPTIHVQLLGPVQLLRDGVPVTSPELRRGRVRELLADLALHRGASRESIAAELWPDLDEAAADRNLYRAKNAGRNRLQS